jgi:UDP:flavonoid glycosyltransferase YjiC (YdhE family)
MANILVAATPAPGHVNPMLSVARHLSSLGHSITFLSGRLFRDQAVALGFQFVPFSGVADFDYRRLDEEFPEVAAAKPGPEAMNAICMYTGIDPVPDQYRTIQ